ncbi:S-layer homology domain-containing protein [Flavonifractor hominis]|uniref:S-layer homology domain-containing protein n=1 Tax=Flavonifractor hominis TaxID=3133178 RepID=A0ABV1EQK5_9FIRM
MKMNRTKRSLSLLLAFTTLASAIPYLGTGYASAAEPAQFTDVPGTHWAYAYISDVASRGLFLGTGDGTTFSPESPMTRAMFVTVLSRLDGTSVDNSASTGFHDVPAGSWYTGAVDWAVDSGVTQGNGNDAFLPEQAITREQMAVMLTRYCAHAGLDLEQTQTPAAFTDASSISSWAAEAVTDCQQSGLMNGYTDGSFGPARQVQRAEVAAVISRLADIADGQSSGEVPAGSFRITFNSNGGSSVEGQVVQAGTRAQRPADPTRSGYRFSGWYSDKALTVKYDFSEPVNADLTLYAKWTQSSSGGDTEEPDTEMGTITLPVLEDLTLQAEGATHRVTLTAKTSNDSQATLSASSSISSVAQVSLEGSELLIVPGAPGMTTITVKAQAENCKDASTTFRVYVEEEGSEYPDNPNVDAVVDGDTVTVTGTLVELADSRASVICMEPGYTGGAAGWFDHLDQASYIGEFDVDADGRFTVSFPLERGAGEGVYTLLIGGGESIILDSFEK